MFALEGSDPEDVGGVAGVAQDTQKTLKLLNKEGEVVNYNYMSDYCRGKVTADVRRVELSMGPLMRGDFMERVDMDKRLGDLPRFQPLFVSR